MRFDTVVMAEGGVVAWAVLLVMAAAGVLVGISGGAKWAGLGLHDF